MKSKLQRIIQQKDEELDRRTKIIDEQKQFIDQLVKMLDEQPEKIRSGEFICILDKPVEMRHAFLHGCGGRQKPFGKHIYYAADWDLFVPKWNAGFFKGMTIPLSDIGYLNNTQKEGDPVPPTVK